MCGRYYLELTLLVNKLLKLRDFKTGEIFPGDTVPILKSKNQVTFKQFGKKLDTGMLFNARSESLLEKPTFKNLKHGLVLASSYFEWDQNKVKYQFFFEENQYMCCVYDHDYFYIITTNSSHSIHHRQPLFVSGENARKWLENEDTEVILHLLPIQLNIQKAVSSL